jgi:hypothetical protein
MSDGNSIFVAPLNNFSLTYINENIGIGKIY